MPTGAGPNAPPQVDAEGPPLCPASAPWAPRWAWRGKTSAPKKEKKQKRAPGFFVFSPTAESFGVSAQIGSGVVRGGPEVRFHEGSTRVPRGFHEDLRGLRGGASTKKSTACCWGYHLRFFSRRHPTQLAVQNMYQNGTLVNGRTFQGLIPLPFFSTIVLSKNRPFSLSCRRSSRKKDPWKEWGRYP